MISTAGKSEAPRRGRAARLALLPLAVFAAAFAYVGLPRSADNISLDIGTIFAQEIVDHLKMEVHSITLTQPESEWATIVSGLAEFKMEIDLTLSVLPFGGGKFGMVKATLGSAEMEMDFNGERFGSLTTNPLQLGGGGKVREILTGTLSVSKAEEAAFRKIAKEVVHGDKFTVELWSVLAIELRGEENGCLMGEKYCSSSGSFTIPNVKFAQSLELTGASGFGVDVSNLRLRDLASDKLAGRALIEVDCVIHNPSSFQLLDLDEIYIDIYSDEAWDKNISEAIGKRFVKVQTEHGFGLRQGKNPPVVISGELFAPDREQELIAASSVIDNFLLGNATQLIPVVTGCSQPFYEIAATGMAVRAMLPGLGVTVTGNTNETIGLGQIIEVVHIDFNIPVALATLANPLNGMVLNQFIQLELKNPVGSTIRVTGLTVELFFHGQDLGGLDLPMLSEEQQIIIPPHAHIRTTVWLPANIDARPHNIIKITELLHDMALEEAYSKGIGPYAPPAAVHIDATIKVMVGGISPIIRYSQDGMPVII